MLYRGDAPTQRGRAAIVTGGGSGIGAAIARRLCADGLRVIIFDRDGDAAASVAASIGETCVARQGDVTHSAAWEDVARLVSEDATGLDVLVLNAAYQVNIPLITLEREVWDRQLAVSLTGAYLGLRACLPLMQGRAASVVIVASTQALIGLPGYPAYAAAKGGLLSLTRQLAKDYGPGIRVNAVSPGPILTPVWDGSSEEALRKVAESTALHRLGDPAEVAAAVSFLASRDASYITAANLVVDGGWSSTADQ